MMITREGVFSTRRPSGCLAKHVVEWDSRYHVCILSFVFVQMFCVDSQDLRQMLKNEDYFEILEKKKC